MASGVLVVEKKSYAIDLVWRVTEEEARGSARDLARQEAKEIGGDLYAVREGETLILAIGDTRKGHKAGMPVLAFIFLEQFVGSNLMAFRTDQGVYMLGTRDDMVISGIESLYTDEVEARSVFREFSQRSSWNRIVAPKDWNIPESEELDLADVLSDATIVPKLRTIARTKEYLLLAGALTAVVAAMGVWWWIEQERLEEFLREQNLRVFAEQAAREERMRNARRQTFPPPSWAGQMSFAGSVMMCLEGFRSIPLNVPGWDPSTMDCIGGHSVRVTYNRQSASVTMFDAALAGVTPRPRMTWQGNQVVLEWTLFDPSRAASSSVWPADAQTTRLSEARQQISRRIEDMGVFFYQTAEQRGNAVPILSPNGEPTNAVLEQGLTFTFSVSIQNLPMLIRLMDGHVATLKSMNLDSSGSSLRVEAMVHERLGVPGLSVPGVPRAAGQS